MGGGGVARLKYNMSHCVNAQRSCVRVSESESKGVKECLLRVCVCVHVGAWVLPFCLFLNESNRSITLLQLMKK